MDGPEVPSSDEDSAAFWAALTEGMILLQRCTACGQARFPPMPTCPYCGSRSVVTEHASGRGSVYSWIGVDHPFDQRFATDVPYVVAVVEFAEGPRVAARLEGKPVFGGAVEALFLNHGTWTELGFAASDTT